MPTHYGGSNDILVGDVPRDCGVAGDLVDTHGSPANVHHGDGGVEEEEN